MQHNYSGEWREQDNYQQFYPLFSPVATPPSPTYFSDNTSTVNNTTVSGPMEMMMSSTATNTTPGKPKRRRPPKTPPPTLPSPSSPTTFLNASIANFRALVQQHTGCDTTGPDRKSTGSITLCFASSSSSSTTTTHLDQSASLMQFQP